MRLPLPAAAALAALLTAPVPLLAPALAQEAAPAVPPQSADPQAEAQDARHGLAAAQERLEALAQKFRENAGEAGTLQAEAEQALQELKTVAERLRQSPVAQAAESQFQQLQQRIEQALGRLQEGTGQAVQSMQQAAQSAGDLNSRITERPVAAQPAAPPPAPVAAAPPPAGVPAGVTESGVAGSTEAQRAEPLSEEQVRQQYHDSMARLSPGSDAVIGRTVFGSEGDEVGEIANVIMSPEGKAEAVVVKGRGVLGLGGRQVAVPWEQVQFRGDQVMVNLPKDQLSALPEYKTD